MILTLILMLRSLLFFKYGLVYSIQTVDSGQEWGWCHQIGVNSYSMQLSRGKGELYRIKMGFLVLSSPRVLQFWPIYSPLQGLIHTLIVSSIRDGLSGFKFPFTTKFPMLLNIIKILILLFLVAVALTNLFSWHSTLVAAGCMPDGQYFKILFINCF